jgi:hypothetical protein
MGGLPNPIAHHLNHDDSLLGHIRQQLQGVLRRLLNADFSDSNEDKRIAEQCRGDVQMMIRDIKVVGVNF